MVGFIELCTAYFFIGDHGSLAKEDVRAAYDVSIYIKNICVYVNKLVYNDSLGHIILSSWR